MRNSVEDLVKKGYTITMEKPDNLPHELYDYYVYTVDGGHSIVAVSPAQAEKAREKGHNLEDYEVPIPLDFILEKGYKIEDGVAICDFPYDDEWGVVLDEKYNTYERKRFFSVIFTILWIEGDKEWTSMNEEKVLAFGIFDAIERMKSELIGHLIKEYKAVILPAKDEDDEEFDYDDGFSFKTGDGKFGRAGNFTAAPI